jgi:phosphate starvation-inducible protein PhoH and related proteins
MSFRLGTNASAAAAAKRSCAPKNVRQQNYIELLKQEKPYIVVASGAAGTGKTYIATQIGAQKLVTGEKEKIVITRPTVSVGPDDLGFLPGTLEKKMEPWLQPIYDVLQRHYPRSKIEKMIKDRIIEVAPLAFMRGRTFENAWIICDEAQNTTVSQMLMVLTRIGSNSKLVITGDPGQYDRGFSDNGLTDLLNRLDYTDTGPDSDAVGVVTFDQEDVQRHPVIPFVLDLYK